MYNTQKLKTKLIKQITSIYEFLKLHQILMSEITSLRYIILLPDRSIYAIKHRHSAKEPSQKLRD